MQHFQYTHASKGCVRTFILNTVETNEILLDENQHRLLICCRMAKALGKGEVILDATSHKMCWRMERGDAVTGVFHSQDEMEEYLEHLLENRSKLSHNRLGNTHPAVKRRAQVINERRRAALEGDNMSFHSCINAKRQ